MCELCKLKAALHEQILEEQAEDQVQLNASLLESKVNINNATAVGKLVEAADQLYHLGEGARADRVLLALDKILPQREERRTGEVSPKQAEPSPEADVNPVEEFSGMPAQLKAYVEEMRAKGFEVELIDMSKL